MMNFGRIFPESQEEYRKLFKELGFGGGKS